MFNCICPHGGWVFRLYCSWPLGDNSNGLASLFIILSFMCHRRAKLLIPCSYQSLKPKAELDLFLLGSCCIGSCAASQAAASRLGFITTVCFPLSVLMHLNTSSGIVGVDLTSLQCVVVWRLISHQLLWPQRASHERQRARQQERL